MRSCGGEGLSGGDIGGVADGAAIEDVAVAFEAGVFGIGEGGEE